MLLVAFRIILLGASREVVRGLRLRVVEEPQVQASKQAGTCCIALRCLTSRLVVVVLIVDFLLQNQHQLQHQHQHQQSPTTAPGLGSGSLVEKAISWNAVGGPVHAALTRRSSTPVQCSLAVAAAAAAATPATAAALIDIAEAAHEAAHRKLDRSVSEPCPSALAKAAPVNTSRYKTELCRPFEENGACKYGDKCQFAHGFHELRNLARHPKYKTELCRTFHTIGFCPYGPRCHFIHNAEEARTHKMPGSPPMSGSRPKPLCLGSTAESPSPSSSLSQSPTTSDGSFFSTEHEGLIAAAAASAFSFTQEFDALKLSLSKSSDSSPASLSPRDSPSSPSPNNNPLATTPVPDARLPVFNRLSNNLLSFNFAEMLA